MDKVYQFEMEGFQKGKELVIKEQQERVFVAAGKMPPELVLKNATYVNVFTNQLETGDIAIHKGYIVGIGNYGRNESEESFDNLDATCIDCSEYIICPGFIDGHIHLESSMLSPAEFAEAVVPHGTTAVITDPHEIANVAGTDGIEYMLNSTSGLPLDAYFMVPSCVPSTSLDEAGAILEADDLEPYFYHERVLGLAELMNSYGTIKGEESIFHKLYLAHANNKLVDGHAPGLTDNGLNAYITSGVGSDHECSTIDEAIEKLKRGQWIMIREGTAAKNLDALMPLFQEPYFRRCVLVTDDKHPEDLIRHGHIDYIIKRAIEHGADPIHAISMATKQVAEYFGLKNRGAIAPGYIADFVVLEDLDKVKVKVVYKSGKLVAMDGNVKKGLIPEKGEDQNNSKVYHSFHMAELVPENFTISESGKFMRVIELVPGQLLTKEQILPYEDGNSFSNQDLVKLAVVERHHNTGHIGLGFLKGYGLKNGAIASSIAHDSHNLIIAGTNNEDMCLAGNCVRKNEGGIAIVADGKVLGELPLPIAGLMCDEKAEYVQVILDKLKKEARKLGVTENIDPFMTLAFMSLPVIPEIRLTTFGLVDVNEQKLISPIY